MQEEGLKIGKMPKILSNDNGMGELNKKPIKPMDGKMERIKEE
jgi:hypothetical protein